MLEAIAKLRAERDALAAQVAAVLALADERDGEFIGNGRDITTADLRAAVTPEAAAAHNRAERAAGWDEGAIAGWAACGDRDRMALKDNPYRADALDGGDE